MAQSRNRRILVVDDEALVRMLLAEHLQSLGFTVDEAATAQEAVDQMRACDEGIGAAVIDFGLPDRKGDVLAAELRALDPQLPLIVASGYGDSLGQERFSPGPVEFLTKPFELKALEDLLRSFGFDLPACE